MKNYINYIKVRKVSATDNIENLCEIYAKLLSDKLPANLGYLYENLVAQMITDSAQTSRKSEVSNEPSVDFSSFPRSYEKILLT